MTTVSTLKPFLMRKHTNFPFVDLSMFDWNRIYSQNGSPIKSNGIRAKEEEELSITSSNVFTSIIAPWLTWLENHTQKPKSILLYTKKKAEKFENPSRLYKKALIDENCTLLFLAHPQIRINFIIFFDSNMVCRHSILNTIEIKTTK